MPSSQIVCPPPFFGKKERKISVRPGLDLILGDFRLDRPDSFNFRTSGETCELAFVLSGTISHQLSGQIREIVVPPGHAAVWTPPPREVRHECLPDENIRFACISIRRSLLNAMLGQGRRESPLPALFPPGQSQDIAPHRIVPMSASMQAAVQQIFLSPYAGCAGSLFLEGKALELLSHTVAGIFPLEAVDGENPPRRISPQIRLARETLLRDMVSPPSLTDLAGYVGLSVTSLTRGFRSAYGVSVFEFLRNERLEKARMLLEAGEMNVTEVAYSVGFSSPAHLTRLFSRYFNMNPSALRREFLKT